MQKARTMLVLKALGVPRSTRSTLDSARARAAGSAEVLIAQKVRAVFGSARIPFSTASTASTSNTGSLGTVCAIGTFGTSGTYCPPCPTCL